MQDRPRDPLSHATRRKRPTPRFKSNVTESTTLHIIPLSMVYYVRPFRSTRLRMAPQRSTPLHSTSEKKLPTFSSGRTKTRRGITKSREAANITLMVQPPESSCMKRRCMKKQCYTIGIGGTPPISADTAVGMTNARSDLSRMPMDGETRHPEPQQKKFSRPIAPAHQMNGR